MEFFVALILGLLAYVIVKFVVSKVDAIASLADLLGFIAFALTALWYVGYVR